MASGVAAVWVPVQDMDRALSFYRDSLGLTVKEEDPNWSALDANGLMIGLNARETATASDDGGAVITFEPEGSIDDEVARLRGLGCSSRVRSATTTGVGLHRSKTAKAMICSSTPRPADQSDVQERADGRDALGT